MYYTEFLISCSGFHGILSISGLLYLVVVVVVMVVVVWWWWCVCACVCACVGVLVSERVRMKGELPYPPKRLLFHINFVRAWVDGGGG